MLYGILNGEQLKRYRGYFIDTQVYCRIWSENSKRKASRVFREKLVVVATIDI